jgi:hypothetical protein
MMRKTPGRTLDRTRRQVNIGEQKETVFEIHVCMCGEEASWWTFLRFGWIETTRKAEHEKKRAECCPRRREFRVKKQ